MLSHTFWTITLNYHRVGIETTVKRKIINFLSRQYDFPMKILQLSTSKIHVSQSFM